MVHGMAVVTRLRSGSARWEWKALIPVQCRALAGLGQWLHGAMLLKSFRCATPSPDCYPHQHGSSQLTTTATIWIITSPQSQHPGSCFTSHGPYLSCMAIHYESGNNSAICIWCPNRKRWERISSWEEDQEQV